MDTVGDDGLTDDKREREGALYLANALRCVTRWIDAQQAH